MLLEIKAEERVDGYYHRMRHRHLTRQHPVRYACVVAGAENRPVG
jgi:hypothetical protein